MKLVSLVSITVLVSLVFSCTCVYSESFYRFEEGKKVGIKFIPSKVQYLPGEYIITGDVKFVPGQYIDVSEGIYLQVWHVGPNTNWLSASPDPNNSEWFLADTAQINPLFNDVGRFNYFVKLGGICYWVVDDKDIYHHLSDGEVLGKFDGTTYHGVPGENAYKTPTPTSPPNPNQTATQTWTPTSTPTFTYTANKTYTPVKTPTPTKTITQTPTLTLTPTPTVPYYSFGVLSDPLKEEEKTIETVDIIVIVKKSSDSGIYPFEVASWDQKTLKDDLINYFLVNSEECWDNKETIGSAYSLGNYLKNRMGENSLLSGRSGSLIFEYPIKNIRVLRVGAIPTPTP